MLPASAIGVRMWIAGLIALLGCGARSGLELEHCGGGERGCANACGEGTQVCIEGMWSACDATAERTCRSACGDGTELCMLGAWGACDAPLPGDAGVLRARIRDFSDMHLDFEGPGGPDRGLVADDLGGDDKPVYLGGEGTHTTNGRELFDQWYRDVRTVNVPIDVELDIEVRRGVSSFEDLEFFPIDGEGFGNEGRPHNFHFTLEASTTFVYEGGETFRFYGEDDLWVFINRRLAMDVGGTHPQEEAEIALDDLADHLGIEVGERYPLHVFFAERHTDGSAFSIDTTIVGEFLCE